MQNIGSWLYIASLYDKSFAFLTATITASLLPTLVRYGIQGFPDPGHQQASQDARWRQKDCLHYLWEPKWAEGVAKTFPTTMLGLCPPPQRAWGGDKGYVQSRFNGRWISLVPYHAKFPSSCLLLIFCQYWGGPGSPPPRFLRTPLHAECIASAALQSELANRLQESQRISGARILDDGSVIMTFHGYSKKPGAQAQNIEQPIMGPTNLWHVPRAANLYLMIAWIQALYTYRPICSLMLDQAWIPVRAMCSWHTHKKNTLDV